MTGKIMRRAAERVLLAPPEVLIAVPIHINRIVAKGCGDELRHAHGTCPRARQLIRTNIAASEHIEHGIELFCAKFLAAAFKGKCRERVDNIMIALNAAIAALKPPNGGEYIAVNGVERGDLIKIGFMRGQFTFALIEPIC